MSYSQSNTVPISFIIIGAMKCGTTTLYHVLDSSDDICMSRPKELNVFNDEAALTAGYKEYFSHCDSVAKFGEASATYYLSPTAARRIAQYNPDVKLIYCVRHPLEQMVSHWMEDQKWTWKNEDPENALLNKRRYVEGARYWERLIPFREEFPNDQIHIVWFTDLVQAQFHEAGRCFEFLGVRGPRQRNSDVTRKNVTANATRPTRIWSMAESAGLISWARSWVPQNLRRMGHTLLRKPMPKRPKLSEPVMATLWGQVCDDAERLLNYAGKPPSHWQAP